LDKSQKSSEELRLEIDILRKKLEEKEANIIVPTPPVSKHDSNFQAEKLLFETEKASFDKEKIEFEALKVQLQHQLKNNDTKVEQDGRVVEELEELKVLYNQLQQNVEKEKKHNRQLKADLRKSKKENVETLEQNKELLHAISSKERNLMNIEKKTKKQLKHIRSEITKFFFNQNATTSLKNAHKRRI